MIYSSTAQRDENHQRKRRTRGRRHRPVGRGFDSHTRLRCIGRYVKSHEHTPTTTVKGFKSFWLRLLLSFLFVCTSSFAIIDMSWPVKETPPTRGSPSCLSNNHIINDRSQSLFLIWLCLYILCLRIPPFTIEALPKLVAQLETLKPNKRSMFISTLVLMTKSQY